LKLDATKTVFPQKFSPLLSWRLEVRVPFPRFICAWLAALLLVLGTSAARAAVEISFFSHEFGSNFPHAFVVLSGTDDSTNAKIDVNYGFTATHISPAILFGPVQGEVFSRDSVKDRQYIADSDRHFTIRLSPAEYTAVMAAVERWRQLKQPSYDLNRQNCVHFMADIAARLGMRAETPKALMKKPRSYAEFLTRSNREWLQARGAVVHREPK
jgi:hypothetical protein